LIRKIVITTLLSAGCAGAFAAGVGGAYLLTLKIDAELAKRRRIRRIVMRGVVF
jgi:hypothetical protein